MNCLLLGNGGREAIMSTYLAKRYKVFSIMLYENPTICESVKKSRGKYLIGSPLDKDLLRKFIKDEEIELCVVNNDNLLEAGIIDIAREMGIKTFGPSRKGAKIEWSKEYSIRVIEEVAPEIAIKTYIIDDECELVNVYEKFDGCDFVVKPNGLTSGKGVKVGGEHFNTKEEGIDYARKCLLNDGTVVLQEKIAGYEFTLMGFTDGYKLVTAPATYDYPYRFENDMGPGTGGMGCFSCSNGLLPFITKEDLEVCNDVMKKVVNHINKEGKEFDGVLNGGFFKTEHGIKFMEFNARLGDPETLNVLSVMETPFEDVVNSISVEKNFSEETCRFKKENSYVVYIVSKSYALEENSKETTYELCKEHFNGDVKLYFGSTEHVKDNTYKCIGNSRLFALVATGDDLKEIKKKTDELAVKYIIDDELDFRRDIASIAIK